MRSPRAGRRGLTRLLAASIWLMLCLSVYIAEGMPPNPPSLYRRRHYCRVFEERVSAVSKRILSDGMIVAEMPGRRIYQHGEEENTYFADSIQQEVTGALGRCDVEFAVAVWETSLPRQYGHQLSQGGVVLYDRCERLPLRACRQCDPYGRQADHFAPCREGGSVHDTLKPDRMSWKSVMVFYLPIDAPISPAQTAAPYLAEIQRCMGRNARHPFGLSDFADCLIGSFTSSEELSSLRGVAVLPHMDAIGYPAPGTCIPHGHVVLHRTNIMRADGTLVPDLLHIELQVVFGVPANLALIRTD